MGKKEKIFGKNKQIRQWMIGKYTKSQQKRILNNVSFRDFVVKISESDICCYRFQDDIRKRSQKFEVLIEDKIKELMTENGIKSSFKTEEDQRKERKENETNLTPDILFDEVKESCNKYTNAFGEGAIVCKGFCDRLKCNALILDAFSISDIVSDALMDYSKQRSKNCMILKKFLNNGTREKEMLSAVSSYCYKSVGVQYVNGNDDDAKDEELMNKKKSKRKILKQILKNQTKQLSLRAVCELFNDEIQIDNKDDSCVFLQTLWKISDKVTINIVQRTSV